MSHPDAAPDARTLRRQLREWAKTDAKGIRLSGWLGLIDGLCVAGFAWGLSHMVSDLFGKTQSLTYIWPALSATIFSLAVRAGIGIYNQKLGMATARRIVSRVRLDFMEKALAGRIDSARHQARLNALFEDSESLEGYYARFRQAELSARVLPLAFIALITAVSPVSGGILLLTLLPFVALMAILGLTSADESKRQLDALSRLSNLFVDRIRALPLILAFDAGPRQVRVVARAAHDVAERTLRVLKIAFVTSAVLEFFSALSVALIAIYCGFYLLGQLPFSVPEVLTLAKAFFVLALAPEVYAPMRRLAAAYHDQQTAMAATQRLMGLDIAPEFIAQPALSTAPEISYDTVTCTFPDDPDFQIGPVSFTARSGQVIALKGPTGSGKTTLLRLLLGYGQYGGTIHINGQPLADLSASIAWVSQNPPILAGSLTDNLTLANRSADPQQAIIKYDLNTLVITREGALLTDLNERGSGLSGGQRRKIGLARAALKDAPILLLDEPTADLDAAAEDSLIAHLPDLFKGRTVILSSHSPKLCALADQVVELS